MNEKIVSVCVLINNDIYYIMMFLFTDDEA